ncbi:hypothetical protein MMC14_008311 [Varicellaria rhodocarpa]|nr:hypothetical protein [Varicellaria rhodocarpa]
MANSQPSSARVSSSDITSTISALGTLIGYLGAESATDDIFERLQWPQRYFSGITYKNALQVGLGMPMGGPLHKTALHVLDRLYRNGLFKGPNLGNMLGTVFFRDSGLKYTLHEPPNKPEKEYVRNGIWVRAVAQIPLAFKSQTLRLEDGTMVHSMVRARTSVNVLRLSFPDGKLDPGKIVRQDTGRVSVRCFVAVVWSEVTGLATAIIVAITLRSWFSVLWVLPLILKLLSIVFVIPRESLIKRPSPSEDNSNQDQASSVPGNLSGFTKPSKCDSIKTIQRYEIDTKGHGFLIIEGEEAVIFQFFRHYGHPIRHRIRETVQMGIIIALGCLFLIGLMCSILWMSAQVQFVWLGYQLYATLAMFVYRYGGGHEWATTESRIAEILAKNINGESVVYLQDEAGNTVMAELTRTYVNRVGEGQKTVREILETEEPKGNLGEQKRSATWGSIRTISSVGSVDTVDEVPQGH